MITLQPITETNYLEAVALQVSPEQQAFVAPAVGILARPMPTVAIGKRLGNL